MERQRHREREKERACTVNAISAFSCFCSPSLPLSFSPPLTLPALFITLWEIAESAFLRVLAVIDSECKLSL